MMESEQGDLMYVICLTQFALVDSENKIKTRGFDFSFQGLERKDLSSTISNPYNSFMHFTISFCLNAVVNLKENVFHAIKCVRDITKEVAKCEKKCEKGFETHRNTTS